MSGHVGERRNRHVALVTEDFRLYHRLVPFLESCGLRILGLRPSDEVPSSVQVLLGGPLEDPRSIAIRDDDEATLLAVYTAIDRRPGADGYRRVVFGVDPGKVIGLAVLADEDCLLVGESRSVEDAVARVVAWASGLVATRWEVHVGDGSPLEGRALVAELRERLPQAEVRLVREHDTTPFSPVSGSRHTDAAWHIAMRRPEDRP